MKKKFLIIFLVFAFILTSGFGCAIQDAQTTAAMKPIKLTYWRAWDDSDAFDSIIANYQAIHPNVTIEYKKFRYEEYEQELINALAEDRGPDIFSIPNNWVKKYQTKIEPMPKTTTLAYPVVQGTLKKEVITQMRTNNSITLNEIKNNFVDAVYNDVVINTTDEKTNTSQNQVFGLPLFVDTLALYYNKDLFNNAGIAEPPAFWNKTFQQYVKQLTKQNTKGEIIQSGVSLGGSTNIERSTDILAMLMMQNGAVMMNDAGQVAFNMVPPGYNSQNYIPGLEALRFYTDFANPAKEVYSWNKDLDNSLNMFTQNKLAMMFAYSYDLPIIKAAAPKLNFAVAPLPQIENSAQELNFANYWVETVSKKSQHKNEAWDFVQFMTKADQAKLYLKKTNRPPALRSLVAKADFYDTTDSQSGAQYMDIFTNQALTAKTWYHGKDPGAADGIINDMIDSVVAGNSQPEDVINLAATRVQQTVQ